MTVGRRSRRRTRYYVRRVGGHAQAVARISRHGSPSYFDAPSGTWVHDPLLGAEIRQSDEWEPTAEADLPPGVLGDGGTTDRTRRGRSPRGRHVQAGPP